MPDGLKGGFQTTPESELGFDLWHWMKVQEVGSCLINVFEKKITYLFYLLT